MHCNVAGDKDAILDYYRRSHSKVCKVLTFERPVLEGLKGLGVTVIGRVYDGDQTFENAKRMTGEVLARAREFRGLVDYWEGFNEFAPFPAEDIARYAEVELDRMKRFDAEGLGKCITFNFSCGQPQRPWDREFRDSWEAARPALEYAFAHGHALGLHEYAGPYMQWMVQTPNGLNQWDHARGVWTGSSADGIWNPKVRGHLTLRYRGVYEDLFIKEWGICPDLFITEGGIDNTDPRPGPGGNGYKNFAGTEWAALPGIGDYADQRRWYMWQVSHDPYVKGAVDFGFKTADNRWEAFDLSTDTRMLDRVVERESDLPVGHFGTPPPVVVRPPTVPPVAPPVTPPPPTIERRPFPAVYVAKGDSYYRIARDLGGPGTLAERAKRLQEANQRKALKVGDVVEVPWLAVK